MPDPNDDFLRRLRATFRIEAREHLDALSAGIAALGEAPDAATRAGIVETVFREAHSLKGAARAVNLAPVEAACQSLESSFAALKSGQAALTAQSLADLRQAIDRLGALLDPAPAEPAAPPRQDRPAAQPPRRPPPQGPAAATVRLDAARLDAVFLQAEEMLAAKLLAQQRAQELRALSATVAAWDKDWAGIGRRHPGLPGAGAGDPQWRDLLERNAGFLRALTHRLGAMVKSADQDQRMLGKMVDDLLEDMKQVLMLPFSTLLEIFPRLVRDLARDGGKDVDLEIRGGELEADRRILEEIRNPLVHLVRNCVDHGIERPEERQRRHKPARGRIVIAVAPRAGNRVEIVIADDGAGIDTARVRASAERLGLLGSEDASGLGEREALELIYRSGISTSPTVTEISGRGLGLAIVREKVDKLEGSIAVETAPGAGTTFRIALPLTLATYRGVSVRVGERIFVLPTSHVEQTMRVPRESVLTVENRATLRLNGEALALAWLGDVLGVPHREADTVPLLQVAVLAADGRRIAFAVDEVLGEQEVLVKSLGPQLARVRNIAAATILGSGRVVPILNVRDLLESARQAPAARSGEAAPAGGREPRAVLVVEDSLTARSLLKGILEMAGYRVGTAVDGSDGLDQLRSGRFDLVVSDVDMPRMNGFELTAHIRADRTLAELPVVLVTALESPEDRARGSEVGANAYIVKRSFEQGNLLEAVRRLI